MDDLQLAVQLCLPLEWTINGSVYTEEEMQDMCVLMDDFGGKHIVKKEEPSLDDVLLKDDLDV